MQKSTLKKRLPLILALVVILAMLGFAVGYVIMSRNKTPELPSDGIVAVDRGDIVATFTSSATVKSGRQGSFEILDGTLVKEINFRVGDAVQKGDVIATFDAASLDEMLRLKKKEYDNASKTYKDYMKTANNAPKQRAALQKQIKTLEKTIADLQEKESQTTTAPATQPDAAPAENKQLADLRAALANLLGNTRLANSMVNAVLAENGSVAQTITAFQNLLGGSFMMDPAALQNMMGGMGAMGALGNSELINASLQLVQLKVQETMLGVQSGTSLESVYKSVADSAQGAYVAAERVVNQLKSGWAAEEDGVIREINIVAGERYQSPEQADAGSSVNVTNLLASLAAGNADISSLLSGLFTPAVKGMVIEYYPFVASVPLSKYDVAKISLDQKVTVTSISGKEFEGTVSFISPVASESGEFNISSMMGGGTAKGVEARIIIPEPDKSIIIGLDVDISIVTETKKSVVRVPMESVQYDEAKKGYAVFIYDAAEKKVREQAVVTGIMDGVFYEITEGLEPGARIVRAPRGLKDGSKVKVLD